MPPRRLPNLTMHLIYGEVIGVVVGLLLAVEPGDFWKTSSTILIASIIGGFLGFLIWCLRHSQTGKIQREKQILELRAQSRQRAEANRMAQLSKADFQTRLRQFVESDVNQVAEQHSIATRTAFWQLAPPGQPAPPKPIEYIQRLLRQISRTIRGGGS